MQLAKNPITKTLIEKLKYKNFNNIKHYLSNKEKSTFNYLNKILNDDDVL